LDQTNLSTAHKTRNPFVIDNSAFSRNEINSTSGTQMQSNPSLIKHPIPQKQNRVSASARSALAPISEHSIQRRERCVASTPTSTSASASHVNNTPYQLTPQRSLVA
ncbi:hypothetical protein PP707_03320, partial [Acetobacter pasteurianus]|nr:hypothetical protein [Acetobacter pasteurianus]